MGNNEPPSDPDDWDWADSDEWTAEQVTDMMEQLISAAAAAKKKASATKKKALPKGADPEDFIKYMEECISGDLPCKLCLKGSSTYFTNEQVKAGDVPWYKCGHAFIYGPLTPTKDVIMSKIKIAQKAAKKKKGETLLAEAGYTISQEKKPIVYDQSNLWADIHENRCSHPSHDVDYPWADCAHGLLWTTHTSEYLCSFTLDKTPLHLVTDEMVESSRKHLNMIWMKVRKTITEYLTLCNKLSMTGQDYWHGDSPGMKSHRMVELMIMVEQVTRTICLASASHAGGTATNFGLYTKNLKELKEKFSKRPEDSTAQVAMALTVQQMGMDLLVFNGILKDWLMDSFPDIQKHFSPYFPSDFDPANEDLPHLLATKKAHTAYTVLGLRRTLLEEDTEWCGDNDCDPCREHLSKELSRLIVGEMNKAQTHIPKDIGEENMNTIQSELKAKRILKVLLRFNDQKMSAQGSGRDQRRLRTNPNQEGFLNSLRCSEHYLRGFIGVLIRNTTRKQVENIMKKQLTNLLAKGDLSGPKKGKANKCLDEAIESYYVTKKPTKARPKRTTEGERIHAIDYLTEVFAGACQAVIDKHISMNWNLNPFHFNEEELEGDDAREVLDIILEKGLTFRSMFMQAYLTYDNDEAMSTPISQKAKSIRAIGLSRDRLRLFQTPVSHYIELQSALQSSNRDLLMSLSRAFGGRVNKLLGDKLYIRTCPATPRPGVLPNIEAINPETYVEGVKSTALSMLDPEHPDYDPDGCIVVQKWVKPLCSGVMAVGNGEFTVAYGNAGSTAAEGSELVFTLNENGQRQLSRDLKQLGLKDGMEHHEIEFVYENRGTRSNLTWFKEVACKRHNAKQIRRQPMITQVRGLHTPKPPLSPPPIVDGSPLIYRGNVPEGSVVQTTSINVGQGSLQECYELEKMGKEDTLPEGLVVYAPSGSPSAHVAGVSLDFGFPIVYGFKPQRDGTVWTEIDGWVTDKEGTEPSPYSPEPLAEFYKIGLRDGDRYWAYNLAGMSQFFHNFLSGPKNDPRLEAYLAGVYTTWIIKATLGVAMGEFRHGMHGKADFTPQRTFAHMAMQTAISGEANCKNYFSRSDYYRRLNFNEIGYDVLHTLCKFYTDSYDGDIAPWHSSSYGGLKYQMAIKPSVEATEMCKRLLQGGDINFKTLLAKVNQLESAVHNTGFFFNKFLGDKTAFDIGTTNHHDLAHAVEHWITVMPYYSMFYHQYVNEPQKVAIKHRQMHTTLITNSSKYQKTNPKMMGEVTAYDSIAFEDGVLRSTLLKRVDNGDITSLTSKVYEKTLNKLDGTRIHRLGICGYTSCPVQECKTMNMLDELNLKEDQLDKLIQAVTKYNQHKAYNASVNECYKPKDIIQKVQSKDARATEQVVFVDKERELEEKIVEMTKHQVGADKKNIVYIISKVERRVDPDTGESIRLKRNYIYADHVFAKWSLIVNEYLESEEMWEHPVTAFRVWLKPPKNIDGDLYDMMTDIAVLVETYDADLWTHIIRMTPGKTVYQTGNTGESVSLVPDDISTLLDHYLKGMLCFHQGHGTVDSYQLCMMLKNKGILNGVLKEIK